MRWITSLWLAAVLPSTAAELVVAVPESTAADAGWKKVAEKYAKERKGTLVVWNGKPDDLLPELKKNDPRYLTVIGKPETFDPAFVRALNRVTRAIDADPWTDCRWGLISGNTADDAERILAKRAPLMIQRALATTGIEWGLVESGLVLSDGAKGKFTTKAQGKEPVESELDPKAHPAGTIDLFAKAWNEDNPQLLVSSSHATEFNLEMPWGSGLVASYGGHFHVLPVQKHNQFARFLSGAMFGGDPKQLGDWLEKENFAKLKKSDESKVWVAAGNCLIGDAAKTTNSMVITAMSEAGVKQFVGYVVPTWYGRNGWGALGMWQKQAGSTSLSEAFFLNNQKLIEETQRRFPAAMSIVFDSDQIDDALKQDTEFRRALGKLQQESGKKLEKDLIGLVHDRDVVAFWGDPMWQAGFDATRNASGLKQTWAEKNGALVLTVETAKGWDGEYAAWLPKRMRDAKLKGDADAVLADDFLLVRSLKLNPGEKKDFVISL